MVSGARRDNIEVIKLITERFQLSPSPNISNPAADLYLPKEYRARILHHFARYPNYGDVTIYGEKGPGTTNAEVVTDQELHSVTPNQKETLFFISHLAPIAYRAQFLFESTVVHDEFVLVAHPSS
ncbi:MAG: hypothetical protein J6386_08685 [Candidatus Synoicihabitans palmerolidicus]|nr:hypothetical protein [Candidatus Synoicihabitans palmerolidicus]